MDIGAFEYVPLVGDVYDIGNGTYDVYQGIKSGDWGRATKGAGQAGLGAFGLATLGAGSIGKSVAKGAIKGSSKYIAKHGAKMAMTKAAQEAAIRSGKNPLLVRTGAYFANKPYQKAVKLAERNKALTNFYEKYPFAGAKAIKPYIGVEGTRAVSNWLFGDQSSNSNQNKNVNVMAKKGSQNTTNGVGSSGGGYSATGGYGGSNGYTGNISSILASSGSPENPLGLTAEQIEQLQTMMQGQDNNGGSISGYNDPRNLYYDYLIRQGALQPYRDRLQNYIRDYNRRSDRAYNQDKYLALLSELSGAQGLNQMIGKYTSLGDEAKKVDLEKIYGEDIKGIGDGLNNLIGNATMANYLGLPQDAVYADKSLQQLSVNKDMKDAMMDQRMAIEQAKINARFKLLEAKQRFALATRRGDRRGAANAGSQVKYLNTMLKLIDGGATPEQASQYMSNFGVNMPAPPVRGSGGGGSNLNANGTLRY